MATDLPPNSVSNKLLSSALLWNEVVYKPLDCGLSSMSKTLPECPLNGYFVQTDVVFKGLIEIPNSRKCCMGASVKLTKRTIVMHTDSLFNLNFRSLMSPSEYVNLLGININNSLHLLVVGTACLYQEGGTHPYIFCIKGRLYYIASHRI